MTVLLAFGKRTQLHYTGSRKTRIKRKYTVFTFTWNLGQVTFCTDVIFSQFYTINNLLGDYLPSLPAGTMKDAKVAFPRLQI